MSFSQLGAVGGTSNSSPPWALTSYAGIDLDFANDRGFNMNSAMGTSTSFLTVSRASPGYADDPLGNWTSFSTNIARRTSKGLLIEETRTNGIRNNSIQGVVVADGIELLTNPTFTGTSGTGWTVVLNGGTGSVNFSVTGQATITGDGTHQTNLTQSFTTVIGRTYFIKVTAATNSVFVQVGNSQGSTALLGATAPVGVNWFNFTATATTTFVGLAITNALSTTVSVTSAQFAGTSPTNWLIAAGSGVAVVITGSGTDAQGIDYIDVKIAGLPSGTGTVNIYPETATGIAALTAQVWSVSHFLALNDTTSIPANAISIGYDERTSGGVFVSQAGTALSNASIPAGKLTRKSFSGTLNGGATTAAVRPLVYLNFINATPVNYTVRIGWPQCEQNTLTSTGAEGFATSPIRTTNAAGFRAADLIKITTLPSFGNAYTFFASGIPNSPNTYAAGGNIDNYLLDADDGTALNRALLYRGTSAFSGNASYYLNGGGAGTHHNVGTLWAQSTLGKLAASFADGAQSGVFNGGSASTDTGTPMPAGISQIVIGANGGGLRCWNGYVIRVGIYPSTIIPTATLQGITT